MAARLSDDPDMIRGRQAAERVKAQGGDAMAQALAWIDTAFDETAAARLHQERECRSARFFCSQPCCSATGECCGCCGRRTCALAGE